MADPRVDVTIGANVAQFAGAMQAVTGQLRGFLSLAAFTALAKSAIDLGGALTDMSNKTQVSVEWLQEVGYAASQTGSSIEDLANAIVELRRSQAQALGGSRGDTNAFAVLGVSLGELRTLNAEEIFDRIAESVRRSGGAIQEVNAAISVLGRGGKNILPGMVSGMADLRKEARELGLVLEDGAVAAMDRMGDSIDRAGLKLKVTMAYALQLVENIAKGTSLVSSLVNGAALDLFTWNPQGFVSKMQSVLNGSFMRQAQLWLGPEFEPGASGKPSGFERGAIPDAKSRRSGDQPETDALQRIGGYISGAGSSSRLLSVQNSALQELKEMRRTLKAMARRRVGQDFDF